MGETRYDAVAAASKDEGRMTKYEIEDLSILLNSCVVLMKPDTRQSLRKEDF